MSKNSTFKMTSVSEDPIADAKTRIQQFWELQGKPQIQKIVSSIEINDKHYEFLMMNNETGVDIIIK